MSTAFLLSAVMLGLAANLHCVGMCGPLVLTLPLERASNKWLAAALYIFSKAFGYGLLGLLGGLLSYSLLTLNLQRSLFLTMGILLVAVSIWPSLKLATKTPAFVSNGISQNLVALLQNPSNPRFIFLGFLNAFIPCGMIFAALASAAAAPTVWGSGLFMIVFGIAAGPGLYVLMQFKSRLPQGIMKRLKTVSAIVVFLTGLFLIYRSFLPVEEHRRHMHNPVQFCAPAQ